MKNYYELLELDQAVLPHQIELRIDEQYNHWRKLVVHHNPEVVENANLNLRHLESARKILLDPKRRLAYNAGLAGALGGIGDPSVQPVTPPSTPGMLPLTPTPIPTSSTAGGWVCTNCHTASPPGTIFCKSCGERVGEPCPSCTIVLETAAQFCSTCGIRPSEYLQQAKDEQERKYQLALAQSNQKITLAQTQLRAGQYKLAVKTASTVNSPTQRQTLEIVAIHKNSEVIHKNLLLELLPYTAGGYAFLGILAGVFVEPDFGFALIGAIAGAIIGSISPFGYYWKFGGMRQASTDKILASLSPLGILVGIALVAGLFYIIIVVLVLWVALMIFLGG